MSAATNLLALHVTTGILRPRAVTSGPWEFYGIAGNLFLHPRVGSAVRAYIDEIGSEEYFNDRTRWEANHRAKIVEIVRQIREERRDNFRGIAVLMAAGALMIVSTYFACKGLSA